MSFDVYQLNYGLVLPQLIVLGLIFVAWAFDLMVPAGQKRWIGWLCIVGLVVAIAAALPLWGVRETFAGVLRIDEFSLFFLVLFLLTAIGIILISMDYVDRFLPHPGEYYGLVLAGTLGMVLMASANELLTAYLSLELLSFSSYVLVSYAKTNLKSNEAGMKYIILGALSSALLLYGISLLYGSLGTTYFPDLTRAVALGGALSPATVTALTLITVGLGFKVAAVPFHMWTPDVYEGAPTPITAYLSVASKAAGFALVMRLLAGGLLPLQDQYRPVFALLALLTMTLGNLVALQQRNIKRLLAYSSIGQAGYLLLGIAAFVPNPEVAEHAARGMMLHLAGYAFTNLAAFGAIIAFQVHNDGRELISDMAGFARRAPFVGFAMVTALFSLAGMPLFAGFVTKFYLFAAAARADLLWLVAIAVVNSVISLYYYLLVIYQMYVRTPPGFEEAVNGHGPHAVPGVHPDTVLHAPAQAVAAMPVAVAAGSRTTALATSGHGGAGAVLDSHAMRPGSHGARVTTSGTNGHGAAGGHGAHGAPGGDGLPAGPVIPWWQLDITADMPPERSFPALRISRTMTISLFLFVVAILCLGIYPTPVLDVLRDAGRALFAG